MLAVLDTIACSEPATPEKSDDRGAQTPSLQTTALFGTRVQQMLSEVMSQPGRSLEQLLPRRSDDRHSETLRVIARRRVARQRAAASGSLQRSGSPTKRKFAALDSPTAKRGFSFCTAAPSPKVFDFGARRPPPLEPFSPRVVRAFDCKPAGAFALETSALHCFERLDDDEFSLGSGFAECADDSNIDEIAARLWPNDY